jgi:predicted nucleic acid-binding Zn finger protein
MDNTELEKRKARAATETLVISHTEGGFRVYNPANITHIYMVSGIPDLPKCNCPDFETHQTDPEWRCKHILAVLNQVQKQGSTPAPETTQAPELKESEPKPVESAEKKKTRTPRNGHSHMVIKRSVSPDGRIDSLSVEFLNPIDAGSDQEIKEQAHRSMRLQAEIVDEFLKDNGNRRPNGQTNQNANGGASQNGKSQSGVNQPPANGSDGTVPAQLVSVGGMNTRRGWQFFINVQVNGTTTKLFGSHGEIRKYITAAGFSSIADHVNNGTNLNLPCRVITKRSQDGRYLNVERVFPAKPLEENGRTGQ